VLEYGLDDLLPMPNELATFFENQSKPVKAKPEPVELLPEKNRNVALASLAGRWRNCGFSKDEVMLMAKGWHDALPNKEDFEWAEVEKTVNSILSIDGRSHPETEIIEAEPIIFPAHVMSGPAGRFAELCGQHTEACEPFLYFSYLTCLGSVVSRAVKIQSFLQFQPRLYTVLVGESSLDRKSSAISAAVRRFALTPTRISRLRRDRVEVRLWIKTLDGDYLKCAQSVRKLSRNSKKFSTLLIPKSVT